MDVFEEVYSLYKHDIYNYLRRLTQNPHVAEELTQETFLKVFRFSTSFRGEASVKAWIYKIALNTYLNSKTKPLPDITGPECSTDKELESVVEGELLEKVFSHLTEREGTLITLRHINDYPCSEIAQITGLNEGQVRVCLHRARRKFRDVYQKISSQEGLK